MMDEQTNENSSLNRSSGQANWSGTFCAAWSGLRHLIRTQRNAKVHAMATVAALIVAAALQVKLYEWIALTLAIAAVWVAEAFNTALESLADATVPGNHPLIGIAKDCAAGAVLIAALAALVIGLLVFGPKLMLLIRG